MSGVMEGFGSEVSILAIVMLALKVARDWQTKRRELKAVEPIRSNPISKGETSTNIILHELYKHGERLERITEDQVDMRVDIAVIKTKLKIG